MIFESVVCSAQIMHLYFNDTNTDSKWTEMRFYMAHLPRSSNGCIQYDF
jgi:hypothetical protein